MDIHRNTSDMCTYKSWYTHVYFLALSAERTQKQGCPSNNESTRLGVSPNKILNQKDTAKKKNMYSILEKCQVFLDDECYTKTQQNI